MDMQKCAEALRALADALEARAPEAPTPTMVALPTPSAHDNGAGRLLKLKEVVQRTGIPKWKLYEVVKRGSLTTVRVQRVLYITEAELSRWIAAGGEQQAQDAPAPVVVDEVPRRNRRKR